MILFMNKQKLTNYLSIFLLFTFFSFNIIKIAYSLDIWQEIKPNEFHKVEFIPDQKKIFPITIQANGSINIFMFNQSEVGKYLANISFSPIKSWYNRTELEYSIDAKILCSSFNLTYEEFLSGEKSFIIYFIIENNENYIVKISVRYRYESVTIIALKDATNFFRFFFMLYLSIHLLKNSKTMKKINELEKYNILNGFGLAYLAGSIAYLSDILNSWIPKEIHKPFYPEIKYHSNFISILTLRIDQIVFLSIILISDMFMMYEIEKIVGRRNKPIMTILLGVSVIMNSLILIYPQILDFCMLFYIIILSITIIQILIIYGSVIKNSEGAVRMKAISVLLGIFIPISMAFIGGLLIPNYPALSYLISNTLGIISVFLIKYGLD